MRTGITCVQCGKGGLKKRVARLPGEVLGEKFVVSMMGLVCPCCGYATVDGPDMPEYMRQVANAYRSAHGLLTSDEIRRRRERLGMSQAQFAAYLGVGVASVKRWELGRIQDESSNQLIELRTNERVAAENVRRLGLMKKSLPRSTALRRHGRK